MREKLFELQLEAMEKGEIPVAAIIIREGKVIASSHNSVEKDMTTNSHAEINVMESAKKILRTKYLDNCELHITMEPCLMCYGAIINSRVWKTYFYVENSKFGYSNYIKITNNDKIVYIDDNLFVEKMREFFEGRR